MIVNLHETKENVFHLQSLVSCSLKISALLASRAFPALIFAKDALWVKGPSRTCQDLHVTIGVSQISACSLNHINNKLITWGQSYPIMIDSSQLFPCTAGSKSICAVSFLGFEDMSFYQLIWPWQVTSFSCQSTDLEAHLLSLSTEEIAWWYVLDLHQTESLDELQ